MRLRPPIAAPDALVRWLRAPWMPLALLALVTVLSLAARLAWLSDPCATPCRGEKAHSLIFDELDYVNAARRIDGLRVPHGQPYATDPAGQDSNSEHPQLAKLVIAGAIDLFGDGPFAWRIGSVLFGTLAILGMFALARAAGADPWCSLLAATAMAADNLLLVAGRIGTLDVYVVAFMIWAAALYMRGRPIAAGVVLGIGATSKEVAPVLLIALALVELIRHRRAGIRAAAIAFSELTLVATATYLGVLWAFDKIAPPYDPQTGKTITAGPIAHTERMLHYASTLTSPHGPQGIASYPWEWLVDLRPINYLDVTVSSGGSRTATVHFLGLISPPILAFAIPALALCAWGAWRGSDVDALAVAWFAGTWLPFAAASLFLQRTSYLYYMVIVMPGIYVAAAYLVALGWRRRNRWLSALTILWGLGVVVAAVLLYPFVAIF
jgi:dolichyl-phosphate-mannose-protein mannosyltransferase